MAKKKNVHIAPKIRKRLCTLDIYKFIVTGEIAAIYKLDKIEVNKNIVLATINNETTCYLIDTVDACKSAIKHINKRLKEE